MYVCNKDIPSCIRFQRWLCLALFTFANVANKVMKQLSIAVGIFYLCACVCIKIVNGNTKWMDFVDINDNGGKKTKMEKKEMKIFLCLLRRKTKKRVALFIPSTFCILKLLTHIVMLKMINIYPLFIALSMFQMKHFRDYVEKCHLTPWHWRFYCIL